MGYHSPKTVRSHGRTLLGLQFRVAGVAGIQEYTYIHTVGSARDLWTYKRFGGCQVGSWFS